MVVIGSLLIHVANLQLQSACLSPNSLSYKNESSFIPSISNVLQTNYLQYNRFFSYNLRVYTLNAVTLGRKKVGRHYV